MSDDEQPFQPDSGNKDSEYIPDNGGDPGNREIVLASGFSGPLPPPDLLREYEQILPGAAERIFSMTEQLAAARAKQPEMTELAIKMTARDVQRSLGECVHRRTSR